MENRIRRNWEVDKVCLICKRNDAEQIFRNNYVDSLFFCKNCGMYEVKSDGSNLYNRDQFRAYLFFHDNNKCHDKYQVERYYSLNEAATDEDIKKQEYSVSALPTYTSNKEVENWYPKGISSRVDQILKKLGRLSGHMGEDICIDTYAYRTLMFADYWEYENGNYELRNEKDIDHDADFMFEFMHQQDYIERRENIKEDEIIKIGISPKGYAKLEEIERRDSTYGKKAFVAMKFGKDTEKLREMIKKGIVSAGYEPDIIDEVEHNDYIVPEILHHIRESRFLVIDLTHNNYGAYLEEGYALGLGKQVIQLCREGVEIHFDVKQKNTIFWNIEEDIPEKLVRRIVATIG